MNLEGYQVNNKSLVFTTNYFYNNPCLFATALFASSPNFTESSLDNLLSFNISLVISSNEERSNFSAINSSFVFFMPSPRNIFFSSALNTFRMSQDLLDNLSSWDFISSSEDFISLTPFSNTDNLEISSGCNRDVLNFSVSVTDHKINDMIAFLHNPSANSGEKNKIYVPDKRENNKSNHLTEYTTSSKRIKQPQRLSMIILDNAASKKASVMDMVGLYLFERKYKTTTPIIALIKSFTPSLNLTIPSPNNNNKSEFIKFLKNKEELI